MENINLTITSPTTEAKPPEQSSVPPAKPEKPKQTFKCLVCGKSYSKKTSLFTHHKTHPEFCVHCGENRGSSVENIFEHNQKHINIRPFICKLCGESFLRNQQFVEHEKSHDKPPEEPVIKESKYKCKTCEQSYSNWKLFYKHQQESGHFNEKFLCEMCGSEFHSNFLLSQHIRRLHKRTDETFPCPSCSKVFQSKPNLDSHVKKIHQNDNKTHRCDTCNNTFSSAPNLKQHIKTVHEVEREYECQTCKKPFKAKNRLTRHEREVHLGKNGNPDEVRIFNCDHCQKKYKRPWHQARHSQMKHENSNASTATTSSAGTPPIGTSPEINGNVPMTNNNFNYQQLQQVPQMPSPIISDMIHVPPQQSHQPPEIHQQQQQQQNAIIPQTSNNTWNTMTQQQQQQHVNYGGPNDLVDPKAYNVSAMGTGCNGEYVNYAVNEQYSNKFDVVQPTPTNPVPVAYDSWNQQQPTWEYNQAHQMQQTQQQPMYHQEAPSNWYYDQQNHHHAIYANAYNNYKTDYNCLNQPPTVPAAPVHHPNDPAMYNNGIYYPQPTTDPYAINHQQMDYQHSNQHYHSNYHNNNM